MITPRFLRALSIYLRITSRYLYAIPYEVTGTGSNMKLQMCKDSKNFFWFHVNFSIQCETMIYSFLRLCQMHVTGAYGDSIHPYVIHAFNMVGFGYPVYLQLYLMFYGKDFCNYFNQSVAYDQALRERYWKQKRKKSLDFLEASSSCVILFVYFQGVCFALYSLMKPSKPFFHCSLLMELGWPMWMQIPVKVYECYMFINCWHVIVSLWVTLLGASYPIARWPMELIDTKLNPDPNFVRKTKEELRTDSCSLPTYRSLYLLVCRLNDVAKIWIVGVSFFVGKFVGIYMAFATFKLGMEMTIPLKEYLAYPTSCFFLVILFALAAPEAEKVHITSDEYITKMKCQKTKILRRESSSLRHMAIWVYDFFCFERGTFSEVMYDSINEVGDLIISF
ncbi:unnamed protein product [Orchesella dallaii]|uniref:Gustatory receptor n=1 Tax=Orchesella dallaii TaxID=48710 RepID=A0ABP1QBI2_9HEXA